MKKSYLLIIWIKIWISLLSFDIFQWWKRKSIDNNELFDLSMESFSKANL